MNKKKLEEIIKEALEKSAWYNKLGKQNTFKVEKTGARLDKKLRRLNENLDWDMLLQKYGEFFNGIDELRIKIDELRVKIIYDLVGGQFAAPPKLDDFMQSAANDLRDAKFILADFLQGKNGKK
jgi:hypothetical protein